MKNKLTKGSLIAAIITAIGASLCCVGPLILLALGISGVWITALSHLAFMRPFGIILTIIFLSLTFWKLYITPQKCAVDQSCAHPKILRRYRIIFWLVTIIVLLLIAFPWYAAIFY